MSFIFALKKSSPHCMSSRQKKCFFSLSLLAAALCGLSSNSAYATCVDTPSGVFAATGDYCVAALSNYATTADNINGAYAENGGTISFSQDNVNVSTSGANARGIYSYGIGSVITLNNATVTTTGERTSSIWLNTDAISAQNSGKIIITGNVDLSVSGDDSAGVRAFDFGSDVHAKDVKVNSTGSNAAGVWARGGGVIDIGKVDILMNGKNTEYSYGVLSETYGDSSPGVSHASVLNFDGGSIEIDDSGLFAQSNSAVRAINGGVVNVRGDLDIQTDGLTARGLYVSGGGLERTRITLFEGTTTNIKTTGVMANAVEVGKQNPSSGYGMGVLESKGTLNINVTGLGSVGILVQHNGSIFDGSGAHSATSIVSAGTAISFDNGSGMSAALNNADIYSTSTSVLTPVISATTAGTGSMLSLTHSTVSAQGEAALFNASNSDFTFNADQSTLVGGISKDDVSVLDINLTNATVWTLAMRGASNLSEFSTLNLHSGSVLEASADNFLLQGTVNNNSGIINLVNDTGGSTLNIEGALVQGSDATLNVATNGSQPIVTAQSASLAGVLNLAYIDTVLPDHASDTPDVFLHVIHTTDGITGDFSTIRELDPVNRKDYLTFKSQISPDGLDYNILLGLSWQASIDRAHGFFTVADAFYVDVPLADEAAASTGWDGKTLTKLGTGQLVLSEQNTYTGATNIAEGILTLEGAGDIASSGTVALSSGTVLDARNILAPGTTVQNLQGEANSAVVLGGKNLTVQSSANTVYAGSFDVSTAMLTKTGEGTLTLMGNLAYQGDTHLDEGTLVLDGSLGQANLTSNVIGVSSPAMFSQAPFAGDSLSAQGHFMIENGATFTGRVDASNVSVGAQSFWFMTQNSHINELNLQGTINFAAPVEGAFHTLTVSHTHAGENGLLAMNTFLAGDDSPTDKLIVLGDTTGTSLLSIAHAGGIGEATQQGIEVVSVSGDSSGKFELQGRAVAGVYEYTLQQKGSNWYLVNTSDNGGDVTPTPIPNFRPELVIELANQYLASTMFIHTLHDRLGEPQYVENLKNGQASPARKGSGWARIKGDDSIIKADSGRLFAHNDTFLVQAGSDIAQWTNSGKDRWQIGVMGAYGHSKSSAGSNVPEVTARADGSVDGYSLGLYGTWYGNAHLAEEGPYVDTWLQYGWYDNSVQGEGLDKETYKSHNIMSSVEGGWAFMLRDQGDHKVFIEPQAQVLYNHYSQEDHTDSQGLTTHSAHAGGVITRIGARLFGRGLTQSGRMVQPFVELNWWHQLKHDSLVFNNTVAFDDPPQDIYEIKLGVQAEIAKNWAIWTQVSYGIGEKEYANAQGTIGVRHFW